MDEREDRRRLATLVVHGILPKLRQCGQKYHAIAGTHYRERELEQESTPAAIEHVYTVEGLMVRLCESLLPAGATRPDTTRHHVGDASDAGDQEAPPQPSSDNQQAAGRSDNPAAAAAGTSGEGAIDTEEEDESMVDDEVSSSSPEPVTQTRTKRAKASLDDTAESHRGIKRRRRTDRSTVRAITDQGTAAQGTEDQTIEDHPIQEGSVDDQPIQDTSAVDVAAGSAEASNIGEGVSENITQQPGNPPVLAVNSALVSQDLPSSLAARLASVGPRARCCFFTVASTRSAVSQASRLVGVEPYSLGRVLWTQIRDCMASIEGVDDRTIVREMNGLFGRADRRTVAGTLLRRYAQVRMARGLQALIFDGMSTVIWDSSRVLSILNAVGMSKNAARYHMAQGRRLDLLSCGHVGILALLPIFADQPYVDMVEGIEVTPSDAIARLAMNDAAIVGDILQQHIDPVWCDVGRDIVAMLFNGAQRTQRLEEACSEETARPVVSDEPRDPQEGDTCECDQAVVNVCRAAIETTMETIE